MKTQRIVVICRYLPFPHVDSRISYTLPIFESINQGYLLKQLFELKQHCFAIIIRTSAFSTYCYIIWNHIVRFTMISWGDNLQETPHPSGPPLMKYMSWDLKPISAQPPNKFPWQSRSCKCLPLTLTWSTTALRSTVTSTILNTQTKTQGTSSYSKLRSAPILAAMFPGGSSTQAWLPRCMGEYGHDTPEPLNPKAQPSS